MTGRITKGNGGRRRQQFEEPQIVGGQPMKEPGETKVVDQRVRSRPTIIENNKGEEIHVRSHTRKRRV